MHIIYYDGFCNLCSRSINMVEKFSAHNTFLFSEINSSELPKGIGIDYIIVKKADGTILTKSDAVRFILMNMSKPFKWLGALIGILPQYIQDAFYMFVARNRYRIFGKRNNSDINTTDDKRE